MLDFLAGEYSEEQARQRTVDDTRKVSRGDSNAGSFVMSASSGETMMTRTSSDAIAGRVARP